MKKVLIAAALVLLSITGAAQTKCYDTPNTPFCKLPQMMILSDGYVDAHGTWTPDGFIDKADIEIECLRAHVPQLSFSKIGVCQMASAIILEGMPSVTLNDYEIVVWEKTKIIAERSEAWQMQNCENQQLVLDFPSNTVTLTSTLNRSGHCGTMHENLEKIYKKPMKDVEVFSLVHNVGALFADQGGNTFFQKVK